MKPMKPGEVAEYLNIGRSTVTAWTNGEFKPYFSPTAQGGAGRDRVFTDTDLRIMYLIKLRKDNNVPADQLHSELQALRANEWEGLPDLPIENQMANVPVVPVAAADAALSSERRGLLREIQLLTGRIDELEAEAKDRRASDERYLREIGELKSELSASQMELKLWREGRLKSDGG